jgi:uncharacterized protein YndB with AHSA1/START domain
MHARSADRSADTRTLLIERIFDAPRELVFDAWTKPEYLIQWFAPRGCTIRFVEIDVRPGGRFRSCLHNPSFGECWCVGAYKEIVRPERIVYSLAIADNAGNEIDSAQAGHDANWPRETLVAVTLEDLGGSTRLTLEQNVLESLARQTGAHPGWVQMLDRLAELVVRRSGNG